MNSLRTGRQIAIVAMSALTISTVSLLNPAASQGACSQYTMSGSNAINQSNGFRVEFDLQGTEFKGLTEVYGNDQQKKDSGFMSGKFDGASLDFTIDWTEGRRRGIYSGAVGSNGQASGTTYDESNPASTANWNSVNPFACAETPKPTPKPTPAPAPAPNPAPAPAPANGERADTDGDGLFDDDETGVYGTNPKKADTDGDGADDGQEVFEGTDPTVADR